MKYTIEGYMFHRIEEIDGKKIEHMGFEDDEGKFGKMIEMIVPKLGMRKRVRLTIEVLDD